MLSDVLYESLNAINQYQRDMPDCYSGLSDELGRMKTVMEAMQVYLDLHPSDHLRRDALSAAVGGLDVRPVRAALDAVYNPATAAPHGPEGRPHQGAAGCSR